MTAAQAPGRQYAPAHVGYVPPEPIVARYLDHLRMRNLRAQTVYNRERSLYRLREWHGGPILYLSYEELYHWQLDRAKRIQPEARRTELSNVRQFYRWALLERLIADDPTLRLPNPRVTRGLPRPISDADLLTAIEGADAQTRAILGLAAFAGLRACEIARLDWSEVGFGDRTPHIRVVDGKGGHGRIVPISGALTEILREQQQRRGPVIRRLDGCAGPNKPHRVSSLANDYLHEGGIRETLHQLRHRFASSAYQASRDIRAVQDLLGHASPTTTSRYAAVAAGVAIDAVEAAGTLHPAAVDG
jgi:integrase/recombinase XerC